VSEGYESSPHPGMSGQQSAFWVTWITSISRQVLLQAQGEFSGLGLIVFNPPLKLPVLSLVPSDMWRPVRSTDHLVIATELAKVSSRNSVLHDGFCLIDAELGELVQVAQFLSPSLPKVLPYSLSAQPIGARQMAAGLMSLHSSVVVAACLRAEDGLVIYSNGNVISSTSKQ
jgi:hypothetical protein